MYVLLLLVGAAASTAGFLDSLYFFTKDNNNCTQSEFTCHNLKCIPKTKRCDGHYDCKDNSDEEDCEFILCKDRNFFKCKNGICVSKSFVCDGENDCEDDSDEENCADFKIKLSSNSSCEKGEWRCTDRLCIPEEWVCNGESDCLDGSDETIGCSSKIECDGFKCKNNHCVPNEWRCDGNDDCHDNSDEFDCENYIKPKDCTWDAQKFLCANNRTCINLKQVCDGTPQCPDKSDESTLCTLSTSSCAVHNCSHECVQLPTGPKCLCPKGYHTINDKQCEDINECEIYGICDQKCKNTPGSYECYCDHKYLLDDDKKNCKALAGEAMMIFSSKSEIRAFFLESKIYFSVAKNLKQVVGVSYDGHHVYWTDIFSEHESIVRSLDDGSQRELLVTAGLGTPEDLVVDWVTGNIYFTDAEMKRIGVCTNDGSHCTVLLNKDIRKPRGIALNVADGEMFWTDWGEPAEIARSLMDGSQDRSFVSSDIHWPNGLTVDQHNQRLYWTDAKRMTLESIKLDGTDRRVLLETVVRHPYAIAVFENKLYWSDWHTRSIQSCDKFTGKNQHTLVKESKDFIYGITIFHSALRTQTDNPCSLAFCSDICLLSGDSYSCACPENKILSEDRHTCKDVEKRQMLVLGAKNLLIHVEHKLLGKHTISTMPIVIKNVGALTHNSINNTLYISDIGIKKIVSLNMHTGKSTVMPINDLGKVTTMDYDYYGCNLYWGDQEKGTLEALNIHNMARKVILHDMEGEIPESLALVPESGLMFVSFKKKKDGISHIDRLHMDGTGRTHIMEEGLLGPINLHYDADLNRIFFSDAGTGNIEITSVEGDDRHSFKTLMTNPISITSLKKDLFWVNEHSKRLYWANKYGDSFTKKVTLDIPETIEHMHITSITPQMVEVGHTACQHNNGNCSHLCLLSQKATVCACPGSMILSIDNQTCMDQVYCSSTDFKCQKSNMCIPQSERCNSIKDCTFGEDEEYCKLKNHCPSGNFMCGDGDCIEEQRVCNHNYDCKDKSDEQNCATSKMCPPGHFKCSDGQCIIEKFMCDGQPDCFDRSDESNCGSITCGLSQFRCDSGSCIPKSWECDHEYDCADLSDEHPLCGFTTCSPDSFTCNNGKCIDKQFVCDKFDDCGDNTDESSCKATSVLSYCKPEEFSCSSNISVCLPASAVCNGSYECPGHEDEANCSDCQSDEFACNNKKCIPTQWVCDKIDDCGDASDEAIAVCSQNETLKNHAHLISSVPCTDGFRCKSGDCIDMSLVCNNEHNCYDGSDEGGACNTACEATGHPCSHTCVKTPIGAMCRCRPGYDLKGDGQSCVDINECLMEPPICSQLCFNQLGNYNCDCYSGFLLRPDKKSCKAGGLPMNMLFTSDNQIRELSQLENKLKMIYSDETAKITGLDVSASTGDVYFSIENSGTILRINQKNKNRGFINGLGQPKKLSVDWITNNVYFYNADSNSKSIVVCNFEDGSCAPLITLNIHCHVSAIAVDAVNRVLFYSLTTWWIFNSPSYVIYKTNLDGTDEYEMVRNNVGYITGINFDINKKQLYFIDQHIGEITRIDYDGTNKYSVAKNLSHPIGLSFFENHLYYLTNGLMNKHKLFDSTAIETFKLDAYGSELFVIGQESKQPIVENVCGDHTCEHICLPSKRLFSCLCEDGKLLNGKDKCLPKQVDPVKSVKSGYTIQTGTLEKRTPKTSNSLIPAILIPLVLIIIGLSCYFLLRRRNRGHFNVGMSFYNAGYGLHSDDPEKVILEPGQHEYGNPCYEDEMGAAANAIINKVKPLVNA